MAENKNELKAEAVKDKPLEERVRTLAIEIFKEHVKNAPYPDWTSCLKVAKEMLTCKIEL